MTALYDLLLQGHILEAAIGAYTNLIGSWFWLIFFGLGITMVQLKSQDFAVTALVGLLISPVVLAVVPEGTRFIIYILMAIGVSIILYRVFK